MISVVHPESKERLHFTEEQFKQKVKEAEAEVFAAGQVSREADARCRKANEWMSAFENATELPEALLR